MQPWNCAIISMAAMIGGCATSVPSSTMRVEGIARMRVDPERIALTAASDGTLVIESGCFRLSLPDGRSLAIVWPETTVLADDGRGVRVGAARFTTGSRLRLGGAAAETYSPNVVETVGRFACTGPYFIASTVS